MKRIICIVLALVMIFSLGACSLDIGGGKLNVGGGKQSSESSQATSGNVKKPSVSSSNNQPAPAQATPEAVQPTPEPTPQLTDALYAVGINALLSGEGCSDYSLIWSQGPFVVSAIPEELEGMKFDHWEVNGMNSGSAPELSVSIQENSVIEAVYVKEKVIRTVNAYLQYEYNNNAVGSRFYELNFENEWEGFAGPMPAGVADFYVKAEIPSGYEIDYWIIDGIRYFLGNMNGFLVNGQTEGMVYEAVLRPTGADQTKPDPYAYEPDAFILPEGGLKNVKPSDGCEQYALGVDVLFTSAFGGELSSNYKLDGATEVVAIAQIPAGMVIDRWEYNGQTIEGAKDGTLNITLSETCVLRAVFREQAVVRSIDSSMKFLNASSEPEGEFFEELNIDADYKAVIGTIPAGNFAGYITALATSGTCIGWKIDGVPHYFLTPKNKFNVDSVTCAKEYEPMFYYQPGPYTITITDGDGNPGNWKWNNWNGIWNGR